VLLVLLVLVAIHINPHSLPCYASVRTLRADARGGSKDQSSDGSRQAEVLSLHAVWVGVVMSRADYPTGPDICDSDEPPHPNAARREARGRLGTRSPKGGRGRPMGPVGARCTHRVKGRPAACASGTRGTRGCAEARGQRMLA
jgi:hypothetical protein